MAGAGLLGVGLSIPFILDLLNNTGSSGVVLPVAFYVRPFSLVGFLVPARLQSWANLLLLPVNYFNGVGIIFYFGHLLASALQGF